MKKQHLIPDMRPVLEEDAKKIAQNPVLLAFVLGARETILAEKKAKRTQRETRRKK